MMKRLRWPVLLAMITGLGIAVWVVASVNFHEILDGVASVGFAGFLLICLGLIGVLALLGAALLAATPGEPMRRLPLFLWSRMAREAASDLLPFSQLGGLVVCTRVLLKGGISHPRIYAAMIVDLTTEMLSQLFFTLFGLWMLSVTLLNPATTHSLGPLVWIGALIALATTLAFVFLQRPALRLMGFLARRLLPDVQIGIDQVLDELARVYRRHSAVAGALLFNILAWLASAASAWLILWLMGSPIGFGQAVALESLIFAIRGAAFLVPGALGIQEAGYALLAPAFGLDPGIAVTLSLIKRAREIAVGLPALIAWQVGEVRAGLIAKTKTT
jgi:putative membrane protein